MNRRWWLEKYIRSLKIIILNFYERNIKIYELNLNIFFQTMISKYQNTELKRTDQFNLIID